MAKPRKHRKKKAEDGERERGAHPIRRRAFVAGAGALAAAAAVGTGVAVNYSSMLDRVVNPTSTSSTDEQRRATTAAAEQLAERVEAEGAVLLRNELAADGSPTLPLPASVRKVNVFGWASVDWLGSGSGSGCVKTCDTTLLSALADAGIETNSQLADMYQAFQASREVTSTLHSWPEDSACLYEPSINDESLYTPELLASALEFSSVAIVAIARQAGESSDLPDAQYKRKDRSGTINHDFTRHTLQLSIEERELLAYVGANYQRVVVLLNLGNVMELGELETTPGIGACLLVGYTGQKAASVLPDLLWGAINPSGRTTDTWAYSLRSAPSYANSGKRGVGAYAGADGLYPADGTTCGNLGESYAYQQVSYVDYAEGPYVGYRWYETADAEGYWADVSNEHGQGYDGVVQYPFGYGLSYTSFAWELVDGPRDGVWTRAESELTFTVLVTNTGERAGTDVVQLYGGAPYEAGGIEKPSLELLRYARTRELRPGESQGITLSCTLRDLASYDWSDANGNDFCGYELDAGPYHLSLRHDAHTPDGAEGMQVEVNLWRGSQFSTEAATDAEVRNRFTGADAQGGIGIDGLDTGQDITYLSRADFAGTFPTFIDDYRTIPPEVAVLNLFTEADAEAWSEGEAAGGFAAVEQPDTVRMGALGTLAVEYNGEITQLGRALGASYDDEQWDSLLNQLRPSEVERLVCDAYSGTAAVTSVGKESTKDADGPAQIGGFTGFTVGTGFPCPWVLAQTWDVELAREVGRTIGQQAGQLGYGGWYAPAANLHRSPVGGRNYEYCSEDPLITGEVAGSMVAGAREAGIFCFVKHLIANDGEAYIYRDGVYTWMTEQTLRELYLRPFQIMVERYGATGMMSSYNRLGAIWAGGSRELLTGVLRGEWGFRGAVITDYSDHVAYMNGTQALAAGGDLWMAGTELAGDVDAPRFRAELRRAAKDVLYMVLDARVANEAYVEQTGEQAMLKPRITGAMPLWRIGVGAIDVVAVGLLALAIRYCVRDRRREREGADTGTSGSVGADGTQTEE